MSKSLGNYYTVRFLLEKGADPLAIRYALISGVYTKPLNFTDQSLSDAMGNIDRYRRSDAAVAAGLEAARPGDDAIGTLLEELYDQALDAMCNDLNTSVALAKALEGTRVILRESETLSLASAESGKVYLDRINDLLGIVRPERVLADLQTESAPKVDEARIGALIQERIDAKKAKNFALADQIRKDLEAEGIELRDTPEGTVWVLKSTL